jgi:hypothetical protein
MRLSPAARGVPLALVLLIVPLAGCSDEASAQEIVVKASAATVDAGTAKIHQEISLSGGPAALPPTTATGAMDFGARKATMTTNVAGQTVEVILDGTTIYQRIPALADQLGKPWLKVELDDLGELAGVQGLGDLTQANSSDPSSTLAYLRGAGKVTELGGEEVRGEATTHYRAVVDLERAAQKSPAAQARTLRQVAETLGTASLPVDVWIDGDGRTRRMTQTIDYAKVKLPNVAKDELPTSMSILVEFYDFGTEVSVPVPRPSEVSNVKDLLDQIGGSS